MAAWSLRSAAWRCPPAMRRAAWCLRRGACTDGETDPLAYLAQRVSIDYEGGSDRAALRRSAQTGGVPLGAMRAFLARLDDPQDRLAVVHVVGSKGKGSTAALVSALLHGAGLRVGTYASPHVAALGERVRIDLRDASDNELVRHFKRHASALSLAQRDTGNGVSFFEALTALALRLFADRGVDVAIVEAGLGGRGDATNVFPPSAVSLAVVTAIAREHTDVLGDSIASIVREKVAVGKPGVPLLIAPQTSPQTEDQIADAARSIGCAPIVRASHCVAARGDAHARSLHVRVGCVGYGNDFPDISDAKKKACDLSFSAHGADVSASSGQREDNVATALVAAALVLSRMRTQTFGNVAKEKIGREGGDDGREGGNGGKGREAIALERALGGPQVSAALAKARLPGRFQTIHRPRGRAGLLVLDGAHTPEGAAALGAGLAELRERGRGRGRGRGVRLVVVVAMAKDKRGAAFVGELIGKAGPDDVAVTVTRALANQGRAYPPEDLLRECEGIHALCAGEREGDREGEGEGERERERVRITAAQSVAAALAAAIPAGNLDEDGDGEEVVVCVTGSFTAVAEGLAWCDD